MSTSSSVASCCSNKRATILIPHPPSPEETASIDRKPQHSTTTRQRPYALGSRRSPAHRPPRLSCSGRSTVLGSAAGVRRSRHLGSSATDPVSEHSKPKAFLSSNGQAPPSCPSCATVVPSTQCSVGGFGFKGGLCCWRWCLLVRPLCQRIEAGRTNTTCRGQRHPPEDTTDHRGNRALCAAGTEHGPVSSALGS